MTIHWGLKTRNNQSVQETEQYLYASYYARARWHITRRMLWSEIKNYINTVQFLAQTDCFVSEQDKQQWMQHINKYDWDCHIHNIITRRLIIKRCEVLEFSCRVSARCCVKNTSTKGVHSEPHRHVHFCIRGILCRSPISRNITLCCINNEAYSIWDKLWVKSHWLKTCYDMLHSTVHLQHAQLKTEMQNINNCHIHESTIVKKKKCEFLGFGWRLILTIF